jgi:hypothetical protein
MEVNIYEHSRDTGMGSRDHETHFDVRGFVFRCPVCGFELASYDFQKEAEWERACTSHLIEKHRGQLKDQVTVVLPEQ